MVRLTSNQLKYKTNLDLTKDCEFEYCVTFEFNKKLGETSIINIQRTVEPTVGQPASLRKTYHERSILKTLSCKYNHA